MLAFLQTRIGLGLSVALVAAILTFMATARYYDRSTEIAALKSQLATSAADLAIAKSAATAAKERAAALDHIATETQGYVNELEAELAARPGRDNCRLDDGDAERLRRIR